MLNSNSKEKSAPEKQTASEKTPYRLNLTLSSNAKNELESLRDKAQKSSLVDVLRTALAVYKTIIELQQAGGRVVFRNSDNTEETLRFL